MKLRNTPSSAIAIAAVLALGAANADAEPITTVAVHETWPTGAGIGDDAAETLDVPWYTNTKSSGPDIQADTTLGPSGNRALRYRPYGSNRTMVGVLYGGSSGDVPSQVSLGDAPGNQIKLTFDFRRADAGDTFLLFGLHKTPAGTETTASHVDYTTATHATADDFGYLARVGVNANSVAELLEESGTNAGICAGTDLSTLTAASSTPLSITSGAYKYSAEFTLTRTASGVDLAFAVFDSTGQNIGGAAASDALSPYLSFDAITFSTSSSGGDAVRLDNLLLETVSVPEPVAISGVVFAASALLRRRSARD